MIDALVCLVALAHGWPAPSPILVDAHALTAVGDVDGDGRADVLLGQPAGRGHAEIRETSRLHGFRALLWADEGVADDDGFGTAVAALGDCDGDGAADWAVSAPGAEGGRGIVTIHLGTASPGVPPKRTVVLRDPLADGLGTRLVYVGAIGPDMRGALLVADRRGQVLLFRCRDEQPESTAAWREPAAPVDAGTIVALGRADRPDGDPYTSMYILRDHDLAVFRGTASGPALTRAESSGVPATTLAFAASDGRVARVAPSDEDALALVSVGDLNGDGHPDLAEHRTDGAVQLFVGAGGNAFVPAGVALAGPWDRVAAVGDVSDDGYADVALWRGERAYIVCGAAAGLAPIAEALVGFASKRDAAERSRLDLAGADDQDGDGRADVLTGDPRGRPGGGGIFDGEVNVYEASGRALETSHGFGGGAGLGKVIATGDIDGDGAPEYAAAAPFSRTAGGAESGQLLVSFGPRPLEVPKVNFVIDGLGAGDHLGRTVAVGDFDRDGLSDLLIGSDSATQPLRLFVGATGDVPLVEVPAPAITIASTFWLAGGEADLDGFADVFVGTPALGRIEILRGTDAGLSAAGVGHIPAPFFGPPGFGERVASLAELHTRYGNDRAALAATVSNCPRTLPSAGSAPTLAGTFYAADLTIDAVRNTVDFSAQQGPPRACFGYSVAALGDIDDDGLADVALGAPLADVDGVPAAGAIYLQKRGERPLRFATGQSSDEHLGVVVAGLGDIDGDGYPDLGVAAERGPEARTQDSGGQVRVFHGNGALATRPRYARRIGALGSDDERRLAVGARAPAPGRLRFGGYGLGLEGPTRLRLEVEVVRDDADFTGAVSGVSPWVAVSAEPVPLVAEVVGLQPKTFYQWRARVAYDPADAPPQAATPWVRSGRAGWAYRGHVRTRDNQPPLTGPVRDFAVEADGLLVVGSALDGGTPRFPPLLEGASDPDGDSLSVLEEVAPQHGEIFDWDGSGAFVYRPTPGYTGLDRFTYRVSDGIESTSAEVTLRVLPVQCLALTTEACTEGDFFVALTDTRGRLAGAHCFVRGGVLGCDMEGDHLRLTDPVCQLAPE